LRKVWNDTACEEYVNVFNTLDKSIKGIVDNVNKLKLNWENYDEGVTPAQN
jgi:hypothetical protein